MAWGAWNCYPDVTEAFTYMALNPYAQLSVDAQHFRQLEYFTVILYDKTSHLENVDEARKELFCQKNKTMQIISPAQNALLQHSKRAADQAALWTTSDLSEQHAPSPEGWGWELDSDSLSYIPVWNTLPIASKACNELVRCGCKSERGCSDRCGCKKAGWRCTELCSCHCHNWNT